MRDMWLSQHLHHHLRKPGEGVEGAVGGLGGLDDIKTEAAP